MLVCVFLLLQLWFVRHLQTTVNGLLVTQAKGSTQQMHVQVIWPH